mmetsp:Transcript_63936/g.133267  ORF Transcript_63936/g.133267 Transcript_63936/m.133267 type:complete len:209 (-) Transcript_63936:601-1227(-)
MMARGLKEREVWASLSACSFSLIFSPQMMHRFGADEHANTSVLAAAASVVVAAVAAAAAASANAPAAPAASAAPAALAAPASAGPGPVPVLASQNLAAAAWTLASVPSIASTLSAAAGLLYLTCSAHVIVPPRFALFALTGMSISGGLHALQSKMPLLTRASNRYSFPCSRSSTHTAWPPSSSFCRCSTPLHFICTCFNITLGATSPC